MTTAKPVPGEQLRCLGAPEDIVGYVGALGGDWNACWARCERGDALVWLAPLGSFALPDVLDCLCDVARDALGEVEDGEPAMAAIDAAESCMCSELAAEGCIEAAEHAERAAAEPRGYRGAGDPRYVWAARCCAAIARAVAGLDAVARAARAERAAEPRRAVLPTPDEHLLTALVLGGCQDEDLSGLPLAEVIATAASAAEHAARAFAAPDTDPAALSDGHAHAAAILREALASPP